MDGGAHSVFAHRGLDAGGEPPDEPATAATEDLDVMFARRGCCCFWVPRFGSGQSAPTSGCGSHMWERIGGGQVDGGTPAEAAFSEGPWWRRAVMKVREWSEIVAGPRWKTFIRRFSRNCRWRGGGGGGVRLGKFQYDPLSYAMNFDEGHGQDRSADGEYGYRSFSARYVLPPSLLKTSMDLGGRDAPPLFSDA